MNNLWFCYLVWESLLTISNAYPLISENSPGNNNPLANWEIDWMNYSLTLLGITITAFTLVGCLCCRRNRRPKGFQDSGGSINKEFKNGSMDNDLSVPHLRGLELQIPIDAELNADRVQFEPIPVDRIIPPDINVSSPARPKPPPPSTPSVHEEESEALQDTCHEWFEKTELHVPREKLKYLREIGHGWFGKVVEGCAELQGINSAKFNAKNGNVVVRILTEEATAKEKAWFLGEATPYFKLRHRNILSLFGSCLETDPFLLLFESCPLGDLKGFLNSNQDPETRKALIKENMPTRIAIEIGAGLRHMHEHGFAHTDLSARNCLVASDLSIKLGDYGIGVEKYPEDYYVIGDRALPIRWSAPETIECTETTIETREITPRANLWSYAVLLWEIATWGKRPYNDLEDEKVIEMLFSSKSEMKSVGSQLLLQNCENCASNLIEAIKTCLILEFDKRLSLDKVRHVLLKDQIEAETSDFDQRWMNLRPNISREPNRSASLQDLRGSLDSEQWPSLTQTSFRLGPEEPVKNVPGGLVRSKLLFRDSDSETEEESWRGRVERGAYTEKVKQKSKSVADLMVLVHIELDSDADLSLGPQASMTEKLNKKRFLNTGSDSDLPSAVFDDQFDLALRKLRDDPLVPGNNLLMSKVPSMSAERPKLLNFSIDQNQTPVLRLPFEPKIDSIVKKELHEKQTIEPLEKETETFKKENSSKKLQLSLKPDLNPLIQSNNSIVNSPNTTLIIKKTESDIRKVMKKNSAAVPHFSSSTSSFSSNLKITELDVDKDATIVKEIKKSASDEFIDVNLWNTTLDTVLEQKSAEFNDSETPSPVRKNEDTITPSPQSRADYSGEDAEDEFSNAEDLPGLSKRHLPIDEEDDRKRMSTPDDERSSDSGFRDKESCEEEESPLTGPLPNLITSQCNTPKLTRTHDNAEEEQMRVLYELDTILDAECYGTLNESLNLSMNKESSNSPSKIAQKDPDFESEISENIQSSSETTGDTEKEVFQIEKSSSDDANLSMSVQINSQPLISESGPVDSVHRAELVNEDANSVTNSMGENNSWPGLGRIDLNEDEDSSTMSLRSDNSYVSFGMDEDFVAAIRNELREKLPQAQMSVVEVQEPLDEDESSFVSDVDHKNWENEIEDELADRSGGIDIAIRYNTFGTPLSPILEELESVSNSESTNVTRDESQDVSTASKGGSSSLSEDDVLLIDTQTNRATLVEGVILHSQESHEIMAHDKLKESCSVVSNPQYNQSPYPLDNRLGDNTIISGAGAPLPSPEEETFRWQADFPALPLELQDNLMSTSFTSEQDWDSDDADEVPSENVLSNEIDEDDEDEDEGEDGIIGVEVDDDDDNSSSSGEFVWQQYGAEHQGSHGSENLQKSEDNDRKKEENVETHKDDNFESEEDDDDGDEEVEEEEFTPSAWDATLAPHRSALRSPDKKKSKTGDQKKSVWFKKQRYHCVYEYPKETPPMEHPSSSLPAWQPTSYADWEEMIGNIDRLNLHPMDYFESNNASGEEQFFVSSSNRPFQFQPGNGKYVSQFFPGASGASSISTIPELPSQEFPPNEEASSSQQPQSFSDRQQLGELRHTRDRLKLNLVPSSNGGNANKVVLLYNPAKQGINANNEDDEDKEIEEDENNGNVPNKTKLDDNLRTEENDNKAESSEDKDKPKSIIESSVKMLPSDGQCSSSGNLESKNCDDLDIE